MANMSEMGSTTYNWFNIKDVDKLWEILHVSAQQHRSVLYEDWPIDIWNLSAEFGLFYEDNFDDYCKLKATSLFSNESLVVQSEIEDHYRQSIMLVNLYQHNVTNLIPSDRVAPTVISYLAEISPSVHECALLETPHVTASTGMPNLEVVDDSEVIVLGFSEDSNLRKYIVDTCESDTFADVQTVELIDVHISNDVSCDVCRSRSDQCGGTSTPPHSPSPLSSQDHGSQINHEYQLLISLVDIIVLMGWLVIQQGCHLLISLAEIIVPIVCLIIQLILEWGVSLYGVLCDYVQQILVVKVRSSEDLEAAAAVQVSYVVPTGHMPPSPHSPPPPNTPEICELVSINDAQGTVSEVQILNCVDNVVLEVQECRVVPIKIDSQQVAPDDHSPSSLHLSPQQESVLACRNTQIIRLPNHPKMEFDKEAATDNEFGDGIVRKYFVVLWSNGIFRKYGLGFIRPERKPPDFIVSAVVLPRDVLVIFLIMFLSCNMIVNYGNQSADMNYEDMMCAKGIIFNENVFGFLGYVQTVASNDCNNALLEEFWKHRWKLFMQLMSLI